MQNNTPIPFDLDYWTDLRRKVCERNTSFRQREIAGTHEKTHRSEDDSSIFLWINRESGGFPLHWHTTAEIIMPLQNDYSVTLSNTTYRLKENEILIIPPGELHELTPPETGFRLVLLFDLSSLNKFKGFSRLFSTFSFSGLITPETMPDIHEKEHDLLLQIAEEYARGEELSELSVLSMLIQFFVQFVRHSTGPLPTSAPPAVQPNKQREYIEKFNMIFDYIENHYTEDITLEGVAAQIGFSKFHFSRLFRQFTDTSFYDYLCARRIKAAEALLLDPQLPITEIALQSGFASISTFNRVFKKFKKCTPTEFKEFYKASGQAATK